MLKKSYREEKGKHTERLKQLVTLPLASSAIEAFFGRLQSRDKVDPVVVRVAQSMCEERVCMRLSWTE